jgi:carbonic anhydrase
MVQFPEHLADRFRRFRFRHFAPNLEHYARLASLGQSPEVMVVSCCDSRVDPETIFSAMPGELFVVRNVANLVPPFETSGRFHGVSAALEFAVLNLRVKHIVVMGHSGCGGVNASLDDSATRQTEAQFIANWMSLLEPGRNRVLAGLKGRPMAEQRAALELEAVRTSLDNLRTFPCVQALEAKGRLALHGAYFDIAAGSLSALNQATGEFVAI